MPMQAQRGSRGIAPTHSPNGTKKRCVVSTTFQSLYPGKDPVSIVQEAGWASGPVWMAGKISRLPAFDHRTAQPVASRYTD
jgi:hypothetical protein